MTTHVPAGTTDAAVKEMRSHEAARSKTLAQEGHLLRLWRPPLRPGEWRTLGFFDAANRAELDEVLLSMPLRAWRTDEILALGPHPNDPGQRLDQGTPPSADWGRIEFLTTFTVTIPPGTPDGVVAAAETREADRARELARSGGLVRLWTTEGNGGALGLWRARDNDEMSEIVASLPLRPWMAVETIQLGPHPSDPGSAKT